MIACLCACAASAAAGPLIEKVWTDKAQYRPGDALVVFVQLHNATGASWTGDVFVRPRFLGRDLGLDQQLAVTIADDATQTRTFVLVPDSPPDRGYLVEIECVAGGGEVTDAGSTAYDYSADWTKFPRYGFLTQFNDSTAAVDVIQPLRDYKINVVQYYDWMDEHHLPYQSGLDYWQDLAARNPWVSKAKLNELIGVGHSYNIAAMAYDLMYGAYDDYQSDGVSMSWGAFTNPPGGGAYTLADQDRHELGVPGWETPRLYVFDPASQGWRDWIAQQLQTVYANIDFDGWHIDTLGYRGQLYDSTGNPFDMAGTYAGFINDMRAQLGGGKRLVVNTPSSYGLTQVAQNADVNCLYAELWTGVFEDEFYDLKLFFDGVRATTSKPAVVAGYVNYNAAQAYTPQNPGTFNKPGVLLADAAILANGGWHMELGDGLNMASNEYLPHQALVMNTSTERKLLDYYNFAVAYENLMRDGVDEGFERIDFDLGGPTPSGYNGAAGAVWKLSKRRPGFDADSYYNIAHLINLRSAGSTIWRDLDGTTAIPAEIAAKPVRVYYDGVWGDSTVWYASPDYLGGAATQVTDYTNAYDPAESQWYIEFTLPKLRYWTVVWLERRPQTPLTGTPLAVPGLIEAEDYDLGGEGLAYHDCDATNNGGAYRPDEGVDLEAASEGAFDVGWMCAGEWIEYTANVACSGQYWVEARVASGLDGGALHIEADGLDVTGSIAVPGTGDWQNWTTVSALAPLSAGEHVLRFVNDGDEGDQYNLNWLRFTIAGDADGDNDVDISDLGLLLSEFGTSGAALQGDVDRDGDVDISDLGLMLSSFGATCP